MTGDDIEIVDQPELPEQEIVGPHTEIEWDSENECWAATFDEDDVIDVTDGQPAKHLDVCECSECNPPDWRPLPPEPPEVEGLLSADELDALLLKAGLDRRSLSVEPVETPWGLAWSEVDVRAEIADAAWRARHTADGGGKSA